MTNLEKLIEKIDETFEKVEYGFEELMELFADALIEKLKEKIVDVGSESNPMLPSLTAVILKDIDEAYRSMKIPTEHACDECGRPMRGISQVCDECKKNYGAEGEK